MDSFLQIYEQSEPEQYHKCVLLLWCCCFWRSRVGVSEFEQRNDNDKPKQVAETIRVGPPKKSWDLSKNVIAFEKVSGCHKGLWMDEGQRRSDGNLEREIIPHLLWWNLSLSVKIKQNAQTRSNTQYNRRQDDSNQLKMNETLICCMNTANLTTSKSSDNVVLTFPFNYFPICIKDWITLNFDSDKVTGRTFAHNIERTFPECSLLAWLSFNTSMHIKLNSEPLMW